MKTSDFNKPFRTFFRKRRMRDFESLFHVADSDNVIDIGGTEFNWQFVKAEPHVVLVNIGGENWERGRFRRISGDGTRIGFPDRNFDIAYSNSVIEHVGDWQAMQRFAEEVKRLAPRYYVQTPNRYFFVEPHLIAPFIHWLPMGLQRRLVPFLTVWGLLNRPSRQKTSEYLAGINLLTEQQFRTLFPDAKIIRERFLGMTKSFIAVKQ
jgi:hypothetical protein